ncbi:hypothetical protein O6H91_03G112100 [Diphasiastrum complanatum]|uniref:Uncharacterized protein n=1 Tax=Diphasiastrum complanatum TaxID=34168 RepID=A0ACC2EAI4_DIPCM|nr:hypothetical protein O6H91_03G112100 [Diphasiastrum complanatum]
MLVISGHSRGGKVAFGLALGKAKTSCLKFSAIIALDPVDGLLIVGQTQPHILTGKAHSFNLAYPTLVIGSGFGPDWNIFPPCAPCAPEQFGHKAFFEESCAPAFHFVASEYGHMGLLR